MNQLRVATVQDLGPIAALVNSAYRGDSSKKGWTHEADLLGGQRTDAEILKETISQPGNVILYMNEGTEIQGCLLLQRKPDRAYLGMLTVQPMIQAKGLGRRLLEGAEAWVEKNWKLSLIEMTVIQKRTELIAWYERRGYRNTGRREPFPYGNPRFGIPNLPDLEFVVLEKHLTR